MGLNGESIYRCILCGSLFSEPAAADACCKRAKALVLCNTIRENWVIKEASECNLVKAHVLGKNLVVNKIAR